jgi:hypothetical protein
VEEFTSALKKKGQNLPEAEISKIMKVCIPEQRVPHAGQPDTCRAASVAACRMLT